MSLGDPEYWLGYRLSCQDFETRHPMASTGGLFLPHVNSPEVCGQAWHGGSALEITCLFPWSVAAPAPTISFASSQEEKGCRQRTACHSL